MSDVKEKAKSAAEKIGGKKKTKKVVKKVVKKAEKSEKKSENVVTLKELTKEAKLSGRAARLKLRAAKLEKDGRWEWEKGSSGLKEARKALGL